MFLSRNFGMNKMSGEFATNQTAYTAQSIGMVKISKQHNQTVLFKQQQCRGIPLDNKVLRNSSW